MKTSSSEPLPPAEPDQPASPGAQRPALVSGDRREPVDRRRPVRIRSPHNETFLESCGDFARRVYKKADQDQIFFMGGAIAFNILVAIIPLLLASLGIAGIVLQKRYADPEQVLLGYINNVIPPLEGAARDWALTRITSILEASSRVTFVSILLLVWVSTRLVGTLRAALKEVFDVGQDRNILLGKLFDIKIVILAGTLFTLNVLVTFIASVVNGLILQAGERINLRPISGAQELYLFALAIATAWIMFLLVYRYLPYRGIHWSTAAVAATFTTVLFELLKRAFGWYVTNIAEYGTTYSNVANVIVLVLWVYYISVIFILGGEVGQVAALRRIRKRQKERLG